MGEIEQTVTGRGHRKDKSLERNFLTLDKQGNQKWKYRNLK
nr:MAG TPA: hypothetical protein [Caudoviricetes sp.]